ncbi:MAG: hypothetical protein IKP62_06245 [Salinivirgaceae bacterium]|nr:hypothetical protein [Salinivirgaceae bacterium]
MKKRLLVILLVVVSAGAWAQNEPEWMYKLPKAENYTYEFKKVSGTGYTIGEAKKEAFKQAIGEAGYSITLPVISDNTDITLLPQTYNIPIKIECDYTTMVKKGAEKGKYVVWLLCKVAVRGNINVDWGRKYANCNVTQEFKNGNALLKSAFVPGLGQIGKRHYVEGTLTLISEAALAGAGTLCYLKAQDKLDIMHSDGVSYEDFTNSRTTYNRLRDASYVIWGAAAGLYVFNLFRAYTMQPKYKDGISLNPVILQDEKAMMAPGVAMRVRF